MKTWTRLNVIPVKTNLSCYSAKFTKSLDSVSKKKFRQAHELKSMKSQYYERQCNHEKTLMRTIPDLYKLFLSDQCADSQENLMKRFDNFGISLLEVCMQNSIRDV